MSGVRVRAGLAPREAVGEDLSQTSLSLLRVVWWSCLAFLQLERHHPHSALVFTGCPPRAHVCVHILDSGPIPITSC